MKRDGACVSCWQTLPSYMPDSPDYKHEVFDVLIAGGGITGLTTALLLQSAGKRCIICESHSLGFGTTGGSSAHLNTLLDTPYYTVIKNFNEADALLLHNGAKQAIDLIRQNIRAYTIDCSFLEKSGILLALNDDHVKELQQIVESGQQVGMDIEYTDTDPLPLTGIQKATISGQAQFHPTKYLQAIAHEFENKGGVIIENNPVIKTEEKEELYITTHMGVIKAKNIIYATHTPPGVNFLHLQLTPYRSYVMAVQLNDEHEYPVALVYDMVDPYHYYRTEEIEGKKYLIAGGEDHKTGHEENTEKCFTKLEAHIRGHFNVAKVAWKWSSQYYESADGLPYIGHFPGFPENRFVATGFGGNGLTYGNLSAIILRDMILTGTSQFEKLMDPNRVKPIAGFKNVVSSAADVVKNLITSRIFRKKIESIVELAHGEGKVVKYEGHSVGLYKDENGAVHAVNPDCPHLHCSVAWNSAEQSWDCPCHGSRFNADGKVLTAPTTEDLQVVKLTTEEPVNE